MLDAGCWMLDSGSPTHPINPQITQIDADPPSHSILDTGFSMLDRPARPRQNRRDAKNAKASQ
jgi:hypothetical protein